MRFPTILAAACLLLASCKKEGCTDASAYNFNPDAELEDGTCQYSGCTDQLALNYDEEAEVNDGSCVYLEDLQPTFDGYTYKVVQIGEQVWFAENLRTTVYANGDPISAGLTATSWIGTNWGATAVYGEGDSDCSHASPSIDACDEVQSLAEYGRLYNWYAVDDARGLCPSGWHVPTDEEWTELEDYIISQGFDGTEGTALKSTTGWFDGANGTDYFGFSALPGGSRYHGYVPLYTYLLGWFSGAGVAGRWWSSSPDNGDAYGRSLVSYDNYQYNIIRGRYELRRGFSVRCLRDAE